MSMKNPLTRARIEPATFRFVAQHCPISMHVNITIDIEFVDKCSKSPIHRPPFYESLLCGTKMGGAGDRNVNEVEERYSVSSASQFVLMPHELYEGRH